jgi:hypothetical protein
VTFQLQIVHEAARAVAQHLHRGEGRCGFVGLEGGRWTADDGIAVQAQLDVGCGSCGSGRRRAGKRKVESQGRSRTDTCFERSLRNCGEA